MRITDLAIHVIDASWREWVLLEVLTDEGLVGVGEATVEGHAPAVAATLAELRERLVGRDPREIAALTASLQESSFWGGVVFRSSVGGIEIACWDILGKSVGLPIHRLFGGAVRERVPCYTHVSEASEGHSVEERADEARAAVAAGWTAMKWDPLPAGGAGGLDRAMIAGVVAQVEAVRGAVGPDVEILLDLHGRPEPYAAVRLATALETVRPYFLEEPVPPGDVEALALVAERSRVPLATGERVFTTQEWLPIVARGLVEHIQPDVIQVGGLLEARKIAALAEARHLRVAPHNPRSPVGTAASLHLSAVLPDLSLLEMPADDYLWYATWRDELVRDPSALRVEDGCLRVPDAPGLGVELDHQAVARHRSRGGVATV